MRNCLQKNVFGGLIFGCLILSGGCNTPSHPETMTIYTNAVIWTGNPQQPYAEAMAIVGERIKSVGSSAQMMALKTEKTTVVDIWQGSLLYQVSPMRTRIL